MRVSSTTILAGIATAQAQNQMIATWFSTSTASLYGISTWRSVAYGPSPVTPIPTNYGTLAPGNSTVTAIVSEPTASRNINITSWSTVQVTPLPGTKTVIITTTATSFGISTISMEGTGTSTAYKYSTPSTITFTSTVCANSGGSLPKTTVTKYTGTYTPFPGQFPTTTPKGFPTSVTSYVQAIVNLRVFPYIGTTDYFNATTTSTNWQSTTTITSTSTSLVNGLISAIWTYTTYTTTTVTFWTLGSSILSTSIACPQASDASTATATVTYAAQCNPTNQISSHDDRGVAIIRDYKLDKHKWASQGANYNTDLIGAAFKDPALCCQLCVENARAAGGGCVASEWTGSWLEGCKLWYFVGEKGTIWDVESCEGRELEYYSDEEVFPGQGSFLQAVGGKGCAGLRYLGRD